MNELRREAIPVGHRVAHVVTGGAASDRSMIVMLHLTNVLEDRPGAHIEMLDGLHVPLPELAEWAETVEFGDHIAWTDFPAHLPAAHDVLEEFVNRGASVVVTLEEPW